jgi:NAD(P)-dependent dehydrogenase (short-subunit alcohol dehydrogenase family)
LRRLLGNRRSRTSRPLAKGVLRTNNPSKRMADLLEIAKLAVYLASDDSAYVVGADFLIDGGVTAISGVGV